ncbi:MAG: biotin/lipoyl-binding protein [Lachnospiraceae bacterium]|nr:biotin/lipoyl-binding protein [Lachnospiraceae bacterium]
MNKKKVGITVGVIAVALAAGFGAYNSGKLDFGLFQSSTEDKVYVETVSDIMGSGITGNNRYSGVVQTQKTVSVNPDSDKKVKEILVAVGDTVEVGTPLFTYDMEEQEMNLAQLKLDLEEINDNITQYNKDLAELVATRDAAPEEEKFQYVTDIQEKQADIKQAEYDRKSKQLEIDNATKSMEVTEVDSTTSGVVKSVKAVDDDDDENNSTSYDTTEEAMITIMQLGNYRVKGTVNEQNYASLTVGGSVIVRSRADETLTWTGKIASIDTENTKSDDDDYSSSSETSSSSYPFYVELDNTDGLIIGQHVLIEMDEGQTVAKEGLWLYESYIVREYAEDGTETDYVWMMDSKEKLKKAVVELGEYDENLGEVEILSGLTEDDYIAFPMDNFYEGVTAVKDASEVDYSSDLYNMDTDFVDEEGDFTDDSDYIYEDVDGSDDSAYEDDSDYVEEDALPEDEGTTSTFEAEVTEESDDADSAADTEED